jgi:tetratricopeptide (TPR) repeat protein
MQHPSSRAPRHGVRRALAPRALLLCGAIAASACHAPAPASAPSAPSPGDEAQRAFERGRELARLGDSVRAEQYLAAALRGGYQPLETLRWLIGVCSAGSRLRAAIHYAEPYLAAHPEAAGLRYVVATLLLGLGQPLRARELLLEIAERAPELGDARYLLGLVEWEAFGDAARAREHFRAYLERAPEGAHRASADAWLERHPAEVAQ